MIIHSIYGHFNAYDNIFMCIKFFNIHAQEGNNTQLVSGSITNIRFCSIFCNYIQCDIFFSLIVAIWKNLLLATILHLLRKHICAQLQPCSQFTSRTVSA